MIIRNRLLLTISVLLLSLGSLYAQGHSHKDRIKVMGYGQIYAEAGRTSQKINSATFGINKIEALVLGQITDKWSMGVGVQFKSPVMLKDLYMQYAFMPQFKVKIGQFKTPFSHENQVAPFLNPIAVGGSLPTIYFAGIATNPLYQGTSGRDIGLELSGELFDSLLSYKVVAFNGQGMNAKDLNIGKLLGGSLYVRPLKELSLHTSYLGGKQIAMAADKGIAQGEDYISHRASVAVVANTRPISLSAEYMYGNDGGTNGMGGYLTAAIHLPHRYDLVVSADYLDTDSTREGVLCGGVLGVDRWFRGNNRLQLQYRYIHSTDELTMSQAGHTLRVQLQFAF